MNMRIKRGQILRELRESRNLKQSDLANKLSITQQAYQRYEKGSSEPNADGLTTLSDFYGVTTDYLLGREQEEQDPLETLARQYFMDVTEEMLLEMYLDLPEPARRAVIKFLKDGIARAERKKASEQAIAKIQKGTTYDAGTIEDWQQSECDAKKSVG